MVYGIARSAITGFSRNTASAIGAEKSWEGGDGMNWTAVIITVLVCSTALALANRMKVIAKIWLEGLKTMRDTQAMIHGYRPRGNSK